MFLIHQCDIVASNKTEGANVLGNENHRYKTESAQRNSDNNWVKEGGYLGVTEQEFYSDESGEASFGKHIK